MSARFILGKNLSFFVEVSGDGFVSSALTTAGCILRRFLLIKRCQTSRNWFLLRWYTRNKHGPHQPPSKIHTSPKLALAVMPFFSFRRLTSRSWKWPMLGIYMTKLMGIPCELKRPWRRLAWIYNSDSPTFFLGEGSRTSREPPEKTWKSLGLFLLVLFSGVFAGCGDFLVANWCRCAERITSWPWLLRRNVAMIWSVRLMRWWPRLGGLYNVLWGYGDYIEDPC